MNEETLKRALDAVLECHEARTALVKFAPASLCQALHALGPYEGNDDRQKRGESLEAFARRLFSPRAQTRKNRVCDHVEDNQGLCHGCGIILNHDAWDAYTGRSTS